MTRGLASGSASRRRPRPSSRAPWSSAFARLTATYLALASAGVAMGDVRGAVDVLQKGAAAAPEGPAPCRPGGGDLAPAGPPPRSRRRPTRKVAALAPKDLYLVHVPAGRGVSRPGETGKGRWRAALREALALDPAPGLRIGTEAADGSPGLQRRHGRSREASRAKASAEAEGSRRRSSTPTTWAWPCCVGRRKAEAAEQFRKSLDLTRASRPPANSSP